MPTYITHGWTPTPVFGYRRRLVVKFHDGIGLPYETPTDGDDPIGDLLRQRDLVPWDLLVERHPDIRFEPLFTTVSGDDLDRLVRTAQRRTPSYSPPDFRSYFVTPLPWGHDSEQVVETISGWDAVETAYVEALVTLSSVEPENDPMYGGQGYLDPAPVGIDIEAVWPREAPDGTLVSGFHGGDGAGSRVVDVEAGWTLDHEDLSGVTLLGGTVDDAAREHGTAVLGLMVATDNDRGCVGVAPAADADVVSYQDLGVADAIMAAHAALSSGDVILLPLTVRSDSPRGTVPVEASDAEYEAIRLATSAGVAVVEAAGNGSTDLDSVANREGDQVLNRGHPDFRDSGAIVVAAGTSDVPHRKTPTSNHGKRIDCYAWGENVTTLSSNSLGATDQYTTTFEGTSAAAAIIAGVALVVQGLARELLARPFSTSQLRDILSEPMN